MTITVGIDTYCTLAEADEYFNSTLKASAWAALSENEKEICLKMACRKMENLDFTGKKLHKTQSLQFPRNYGMPEDIKNAQAELALWLYQNQNNKIAQAQAMGIKSLSLGNESYSLGNPTGSIQCPEAWEYLNKWTKKGYKVC